MARRHRPRPSFMVYALLFYNDNTLMEAGAIVALREPAARRSVVRLMKWHFAVPLAALVSSCLTPPPPPPPPYHAVGTEPFWNLLIDERNLTFVRPDAQPITQPTP